MSQEYIFSVQGAEQFDQHVIEASFSTPVLVDFWADWCAPCKALMPVLEKLVTEYNGTLQLAKVDCDAEQEIVARFGVRSLPTVVLFKDGQPIDGFSGAQTEPQVREMLSRHLPEPQPASNTPFEQALELFERAQFSQAQSLLKVLLEQDNSNPGALILYARCLIEGDELEAAGQILDSIQSDEHQHELAAAKAQLTFLRLAQDMPDPASLKARIAQNSGDDEATYQLAIQQLARQQYEAAMQNLLLLFSRSREYADGAAQRTLLQTFELLGSSHPLVILYRRKLYQLLY